MSRGLGDVYKRQVLYLTDHLKYKQVQAQLFTHMLVEEKRLSSLKILHLVQDIVVEQLLVELQTKHMYIDL